MKTFFFYFGLGLQIFGFSLVGFCLFLGLLRGDYDKLQLVQFLGGSFVFYLGHFLRVFPSKS